MNFGMAYTDDEHGHFNTEPYVCARMPKHARTNGIEPALERVQPEVGTALPDHLGDFFIWGEGLTQEVLNEISEACREIASEYEENGEDEKAKNARRAAFELSDAEFSPAGRGHQI